MKILYIESQVVDSNVSAQLLYLSLTLAKEAKYTHVHDYWGHNAYDSYTIDHALTIFKPINEDNTDYENDEIF